jgi:hypothetical protein
MPRGKKKSSVSPVLTPTPTKEQREEMEKLVDKLAEEAIARTFCNHRNMHAEGDVRCILPKGHKGDHSDGKYSWSDAAGTPPRKHA